MAGWRTAYASVVGTSHAATGTPCQDFGRCNVVLGPDGAEILVAAVADGAGSAAHSENGSRLTVDAYLATFGALVAKEPDLACIDRASVLEWLNRLRDRLDETAMAEGHAFSDYACTLLGAVVGPTRAMFVQIGDGAIVVRDGGADDYSWVFWPQNGEYANSTNFVTQDDFECALELELADTVPIEIALFSDGIERLVLDMAGRRVHSPALRPIFQWLGRSGIQNDASGENSALVAFLQSEKVNNRTDDDKTLVMATRTVSDLVA